MDTLDKECWIWSFQAVGKQEEHSEDWLMQWRRTCRRLLWQRRTLRIEWYEGRCFSVVTPKAAKRKRGWVRKLRDHWFWILPARDSSPLWHQPKIYSVHFLRKTLSELFLYSDMKKLSFTDLSLCFEEQYFVSAACCFWVQQLSACFMCLCSSSYDYNRNHKFYSS